MTGEISLNNIASYTATLTAVGVALDATKNSKSSLLKLGSAAMAASIFNKPTREYVNEITSEIRTTLSDKPIVEFVGNVAGGLLATAMVCSILLLTSLTKIALQRSATVVVVPLEIL